MCLISILQKVETQAYWLCMAFEDFEASSNQFVEQLMFIGKLIMDDPDRLTYIAADYWKISEEDRFPLLKILLRIYY